jgi:tetratricopeptide (TPR) repeat protein
MQRKTLMLVLLALFLLIPAVQAEDTLEWTTRGLAANDAGKYSDAITYFNNALAQDAYYTTALSGKAAALNALGDYTGALDAADKTLTNRSQDQRALNARALALFRLQRYNESIVAYNTLFTVYQINIPEPYCNQGYAFASINKTANSIVAYKKCTQLDSQNIMMWNQLGNVYMMQGDYTNALATYDSATGITVLNATLWNNKGKAYVALGMPNDALQCFNKALGIDPNFAEARMNKEDMNGLAQTFHVSIATPLPTPTLNRLGTSYPTATPTPQATDVVTTAATPVQTQENVVVTSATPEKKTTYSPLSPLTVLGSLIVIAGLAAIRSSRK